ncbi:putative transcription factor, K-box [Helianthus debilis subsp. tardiflorus]
MSPINHLKHYPGGQVFESCKQPHDIYLVHISLHEGSLTFVFVSPYCSMRKTIERYREHVKKDENCIPETEVNTQKLRKESAIIQQKLEQLEASRRKYLGQDLVSCSLDEVIELDSKLEHALRTIRERKAHLFKEQTEKLKAKERYLMEENARLVQETAILSQKRDRISPQRYAKEKDVITSNQSSPFSEVETDLFVGLRPSHNYRD